MVILLRKVMGERPRGSRGREDHCSIVGPAESKGGLGLGSNILDRRDGIRRRFELMCCYRMRTDRR